MIFSYKTVYQNDLHSVAYEGSLWLVSALTVPTPY